ncbi:MAG: hypothetical protein K2O97_05825, partial [Acetatifactor sp.]|nr:hypothetical protein [Acetatifactor sp.]
YYHKPPDFTSRDQAHKRHVFPISGILPLSFYPVCRISFFDIRQIWSVFEKCFLRGVRHTLWDARPNLGGVVGLRLPNRGAAGREVGRADRGDIFSYKFSACYLWVKMEYAKIHMQGNHRYYGVPICKAGTDAIGMAASRRAQLSHLRG